MSIYLKPCIFASWIPDGKIFFQPKLFATLVALDKVSADTTRRVVKTETISSTTLRIITTSQSLLADTNRALSTTEKIKSDTLRNLTQTQLFQGDTHRKIYLPDGHILFTPILFSTILPPDKFIGDSNRRITNQQIFSGDTKRLFTQSFSADTIRNVVAKQKFQGDCSRCVSSLSPFRGDTSRSIIQKFSGSTSRHVVTSQKLTADTNIRLPLILSYFLPSPSHNTKLMAKHSTSSPTSMVDTLKDLGVTSLTIDLNEMTLSDNFSLGCIL